MAAKKIKPQLMRADDLKKFQLVSDPQISPDGNQMVFCKKHLGEKNKYLTNLWMTETERGSVPRQFTSAGKDSFPRWSPDGQTIAFLSGREQQQQIFTLSANGGEAVKLTSFPEGSIRSFRWSPDGTMLAVQFRETEPDWTEAAKKEREETGASIPARVIDDAFYRLDGDGYFNAQRHQLFVVDLASGEHRPIYTKDRIGWSDFDWSPNSRELVVTTITVKEPFLKFWKWDIVRVDIKTRKVKKLANLPEGVKSAVAWSPDGKKIAYSGRIGREHWGVYNTHLFVCNADGSNVKNLTEHTDYCLSAITLSDTAEAAFDETIRWTPDGKHVVMNFGWQGSTHIASIPANGGDVRFHTSGRQSVQLGNLSADGSRCALVVGDQTHLPEIACGEWADSAKSQSLKVRKLTAFNTPLLKQRELSVPEPHWIQSEDGNRVQVWVMKPPGFKTKRKYPAILTIHGGPHCQYGESFFHEFQVFAAAGYVVVFSNPRGSKGYGEEHCVAIKGDWGNADWKDIQAVTRFMQEQPFIDNKRMGVCGGSYGGYMTNWAIGHTDVFAAAVTDRCVSNLVSMVGSSDLPLVPGEYWRGNSWDDTDVIWEQSPLKHFGNVKTPTLVVHSEGDLRCNIEQGEQVFAALKLRGIPTRFVRYPSTTSHGMSRKGPVDLRMHRLEQYLEWWEKYLGR
ncbi:MAG: S9 family peptidase [Planctomycetaceae bacterium]